MIMYSNKLEMNLIYPTIATVDDGQASPSSTTSTTSTTSTVATVEYGALSGWLDHLDLETLRYY